MAPVSALSVIVLVGFVGGADTTVLEDFCLLIEIKFILFLIISVLVVLPRCQEKLLVCALQRSSLPPILLSKVASSL